MFPVITALPLATASLFVGSLLDTEIIFVTGDGSQASATTALTVTETILLLGGQRDAGDAVSEEITGGVVQLPGSYSQKSFVTIIPGGADPMIPVPI